VVLRRWCRLVRGGRECGLGVAWSRRARKVGSALAVLSLTAVFAPSAAEARYELVARWVSSNPVALDVDTRGDVYVASTDAANNHITRYTSRGRVVTTWGSDGREPGQFDHISDVAVDESGRILVTDLDRRIQTFDAQGNLLSHSPIVGPTGDALIGLAIDVDGRGDRYLTHNGAGVDVPSGALRFAANGQGLAAWGSDGAGDGQFNAPLGIASDGRGNVYVADSGNHRIQKFTDTGAYVAQWGQHGSSPGQLARPSGVATDRQGNVFVADTDNGRIQKFDPSGRLLDRFVPSPTVGNPGEARPRDVAVAANGDVYTLDDEVGRFGSIYVYRQAAASVVSKRLRYRNGRIAVTVSCRASTTCRGTARIAKGKTTIAKRAYRIKAGRRATIGFKPTGRGRTTLMRSRQHRVTVLLKPRGGGAPVSRALTLRR
jgi:sugar lactone lactonase YvrE